jgi:hypothetical protein
MYWNCETRFFSEDEYISLSKDEKVEFKLPIFPRNDLRSLIFVYSSRKLTLLKDEIPAFAGLMEVYAETTEQTLLLGLRLE